MTKRRDGRRKSEALLRRIVADPLRKLLALGLAILLWVFLDSQINTTKKYDFHISAVDEASIATPVDGFALQVRLPSQAFTVTEFQDGITGTAIGHVALSFKGPNHLIDRLKSGSTFFVSPGRELTSVGDFYEFDVRDVRAQDAELQPTLDDMEPHSVKVMIERNGEQTIALSMDQVKILAPAGDAEFDRRIVRENARFEPPSVSVFGPQGRLQKIGGSFKGKLFQVDLSGRADAAGVEVGATLQLLEPYQDLHIKPIPTVRLFIKPRFKEFKLKVPLLLDLIGREGIANLELPYDAQVLLPATGQLEVKLTRMTAAELDEWSHQKTRLLINLAAELQAGSATSEQGGVATPHFYLYENEYQEGRDYQTPTISPVVIRPKKQ